MTESDWTDAGPASWYEDPGPDERPPRRALRWVVLSLAVILLVLVGVLVVLLLPSSTNSPKAAPQASPSQTAETRSGPDPLPLPTGWTAIASDEQPDCAAHAYGKVAQFLSSSVCGGVRRVLATASTGGRPVIIASNAISFASEATAVGYLALVSADGTGNVSDLLREGTAVPGSIARLPSDAAFASRRNGDQVLVAEAAYATGATPASDAGLKMLAQQAIGG